MSERDALFSAILARPADDVSRLVYADWLDESARPVAVARARFIRLQIELARGTPAEHFPLRTAEIATELDGLAARWARAWLTDLPPRIAESVWTQRLGAGAFRRGFVDGVKLDVGPFLRAGAGLFAAAPVTDLHLHGGYHGTTVLLGDPHFRRLNAVRLSGGWDGDRLARRLAKCPDLGSVRELDLSGCRLTDLGALDLVRAPALAKLTALRVGRNRLSWYGIGALAEAPALAGLATLDVSGNPGARWWASGPGARFGKRVLF